MKFNLFFFVTFLFLISSTFSFKVDAKLNEPFEIMEVELPLFNGEENLGEVKAGISGENLIWINKNEILKILTSYLKKETILQIKKLPTQISIRSFPLPLSYNHQELKLNLTVKMIQRAHTRKSLLQDFKDLYQGQELRPAPFSGAINYQLEQIWSDTHSNSDTFRAQVTPFFNIKSVVIENQTYYQSNEKNKWFRGDTRLIKDIESKQIRLEAGDIYPEVQGFMTPVPMGGISIGRNFSLNPYRLPYPTGEKSFTLNSRSLVNYFVNGALIKSEFLAPGNYTARDIPLNNGLNTVVVEATDDLGVKKVFLFKVSTNINLLNKGESKFNLSHGLPFLDAQFKRSYLQNQGKITSGFYQYGLDSSFSLGVFGQNQMDFTLLGPEFIYSTFLGNFSLSHGRSHEAQIQGSATSLNYQLLGEKSIGLRYENQSQNFKNAKANIPSVTQNIYAANVTIPVANILTASIGANYGDVRNNNLSDKYGFDSTLNLRLFDQHNLSFFIGRSRDEFKKWNDVAYLFLTITFSNSNDFVSTFYDLQQKSTKITYIKDNQNRLYHPRAMAQMEHNQNKQSADADVLVPTPFADFGGRLTGSYPRATNQLQTQLNLRLNSSVVFAAQDGYMGMGLSRPINNSFILFRPEKRLHHQKIQLRSTSPFSEAESGPFNEIVFNNLLAYQYREIQLDPTLMDEGRTLKQEKYILYPTYRSGHLIQLEEKGSVILKGILVKRSGRPWPLKIGSLSDGKKFFTNREGEFFIEGPEAGKYQLSLDGIEARVPVEISDKDIGFKNLGIIILEENP